MTANPKPDAAPIDLVEKLLSDEPMTRAEAAEEITRLRAELAETLKKLANQRSVAETYYKNANEQFQRANELERALAEARESAQSAHAVGFAAGIEAAARTATGFLVGDPRNGVPLRNPMAHEIVDRIRALTPPDITAAAARVLLADDVALSKMAEAVHDGPLGADDYWFSAATPQGGWCVDVVRAALRALAEVKP